MNPVLKYHQMTMELLGLKPNFSAAQQQILKRFEDENQLQLPPSLKEWYSLDHGGIPIDWASPGTGLELRPPQSLSFLELEGRPCLSLFGEAAGIFHLVMFLDEGTTPGVYFLENEAGEKPIKHADHFEGFIFSMVFDQIMAHLNIKALVTDVSRDALPETIQHAQASFQHCVQTQRVTHRFVMDTVWRCLDGDRLYQIWVEDDQSDFYTVELICPVAERIRRIQDLLL